MPTRRRRRRPQGTGRGCVCTPPVCPHRTPWPRTAEPGVSPDGTRWPVPCARGCGSPATCHCRVIPASVQVQQPVSTPRPGPCQTRRLSRLGGREGQRTGQRDTRRRPGASLTLPHQAPRWPFLTQPHVGAEAAEKGEAAAPRAARPHSLCPWLRVSQPGAHYLPVPLPLVRDGDPRPSPAPSLGLPVAHPPPAPAS